jgi:hypothetical protein
LTGYWCREYTGTVRQHIHEQLAAARIDSGWSFQLLLDRSGLDMDKATLIRKLSGAVGLRTEEAEALTNTFRKHGIAVTIRWPNGKGRRARVAA